MGLIFSTIKLFAFVVVGKKRGGIELCRFNNLLHCLFNPIDSLIDRNAKMSDVMCHSCLIGSQDISWQSCSILGFALGFTFQS